MFKLLEYVIFLFKVSWELFLSNKKLFLACIIFDALLLASFFFINFQLFLQAQNDVLEISRVLQEKISDENIEDLDAFLLGDENFSFYYRSLVRTIFIFFGIAFFAFSLFNGIAWFCIKRIFSRISILDYFPKFFIFSFIWFLVFIFIIYLRIALLGYSVSHPFPLIGSNFINVFFVVALLALIYLSSLSFSLIPSKNSLKISLFKSKTKSCITTFTASIFLILVMVLNVYWAFSMNQYLGILFLVIFLLPSFSFARIMFIKSLNV